MQSLNEWKSTNKGGCSLGVIQHPPETDLSGLLSDPKFSIINLKGDNITHAVNQTFNELENCPKRKIPVVKIALTGSDLTLVLAKITMYRGLLYGLDRKILFTIPNLSSDVVYKHLGTITGNAKIDMRMNYFNE